MTPISRTGQLLRALVQASCRRPLVTVVLSVVLGVLGVWVTSSKLTFKTSGRDLLPQQAGYVQRYLEYKRDFGELEDIVVAIEARSFETARAYAARLVQELRESPVGFRRVAYRIDPKRFEGRQLLYLPTKTLTEVAERIFEHQEFIEAFAGDPSLALLIENINAQFSAAILNNLFDVGLGDQRPTDTRFLGTLLDQIAGRLQRPIPYASPWGRLFSVEGADAADAGYFTSDDKSLLFVLIETPEGDGGTFVKDQVALDAIRDAISRLRPAFPNVQAGVTGEPALANDEMSAAFHDSEKATVLSFALTLLVMVIAFGRLGKPLLLLLVLAVSIAWSVGFVTLAIGHLTIFSVMFISIVVGIGIDYGIYYLFRYEEEIFLGRSLREALETTAARAGPGMLASALTAGGTFFVLAFTDFKGIQELGIIAGAAIMLSWLAMMTFFPALLVLVDRHHAERPGGTEPRAHQLERIHVPLFEDLGRRPALVLALAAVVTLASIWALPSVSFDYNLLNLQAKGTESVMWERRILSTTGRTGFSALASAHTLDELRAKQAAFEQLPSVSEVDSVLRAIPDRQDEKIAIVKKFAPVVDPVRVGRPTRVDLDRLTEAVRGLKRRFDLAATEAKEKLPDDIRQLRTKSTELLARLTKVDRAMAEPALTHLQSQLYRDFVDQFHSLQRNLRPTRVTLDDIPDEIRRKFVGASGRLLIQVHPKVDIWTRAGAFQFVDELRKVDPDVTGAVVITYEGIRLMERAYLQGTIYAFVLVGLLTYLTIRRVRESLLAMLPLVLGLLWTIGLMRLVDLKFNLANIWGLPLIIGASAEFGLNIVIRYMEGREHGGPLVARSTVMAVALSGITTMVGFASLMVASHQGVFGLGLLLTVGSACGMLASLLVLPVILTLHARQTAAATAAAAGSNAAGGGGGS
jgi:hopanoid biosynthesis associated RND transporter like protein HpnN